MNLKAIAIVGFLATSLPFYGHTLDLNGDKDSTAHFKIRSWKLVAEYHDLHSTHGDSFTGASISLDKEVATDLYLGLSVEYAYTQDHGDNGWKLHDLNFFPCYVDTRWNFNTANRFSTYAHVGSGMTFARYRKEDRRS
jgi:hypothetical protein